MADIKHNVVIKTSPSVIYEAITTQEGLSKWWAKETIAQPEINFINVFTLGGSKNEMKVVELSDNQKVKWLCTDSTEERIGTTISFALEDKGEKTLLRFTHGDRREETDLFASCNYNRALFLKSLKMYCETGEGSPL